MEGYYNMLFGNYIQIREYLFEYECIYVYFYNVGRNYYIKIFYWEL